MTEPMGDRIHIRDLHVRSVIGVFPEERHEAQDLIVNVTIHTDLSRAGKSDRIEDTLDYKRIKKAILKELEATQYELIERFAQHVAEIVLAHGADRVDVTVDKPGALRFARSVAVEISRTREP